MKRKLLLVATIVGLAVMAAVAGEKEPMVGGQKMYPTKNIH
jgi:hypothetical protein